MDFSKYQTFHFFKIKADGRNKIKKIRRFTLKGFPSKINLDKIKQIPVNKRPAIELTEADNALFFDVEIS